MAEPSARPLFERILLTVDRRDKDSPAPGLAWSFVSRAGASVTVCHVVMRPTSSAGNDADGSPANAEETAIVTDLRARAVEAMADRGREVPIKILHGDPGQRICEFAEFLNSDLIVLGPRSRGSIAKSLRGSVSKYVLSNSRRNVLVLQS
jgi:nucleotide-binding universal stress UspA family protein